MLKNILLIATGITLISNAYAAVNHYKDDFKSYPAYDAATQNWQFNSIGGEVVDGRFVINVASGKTQALVRDFNGGSKLSVSAKVKADRSSVAFFNKNTTRGQLGIFIRADKFHRGMVQDDNMPLFMLSLKRDGDKQTFSFEFRGKADFKFNPVLKSQQGWEIGKEYDLNLTLKNSTVTATAKQNGRIIYQGKYSSPALKQVFIKSYPGFQSYNQTGEVLDFEADNLNSTRKVNQKELAELILPMTWQMATNNKTVVFGTNKPVNLAKLLGGFGKGKTVVLSSEITSDNDGFMYTACKADWFWTLKVNGKTVADYMKYGSGNVFKTVVIPVRKGKNELSLTIGSGTGGWSFCFGKAAYEEARTLVAHEKVYGSGKLFWNLDRIIDDIVNLERDGIKLTGIKTKLLKLRKELPANLDSKDILQYDKLLDEAYASVYNGYRYIELLNSISEFSSFGIKNSRLDQLKTISSEMKNRLNASGSIDSLVSNADVLIKELKKDMDGYAEGVSRGRSFGRFGWITSANLGRYSSGDGLLTEQVLADGAIARQYVNLASNPKKSYVVRFNFSGKRDQKYSSQLFSQPNAGSNVKIEFGYLPGMFYSGSSPDEVNVKEINWLHKKFSYADKFTMDMNICSPSLLVESPLNEFELSDPVTGEFTNIAFKDSKGRIVSAGIPGKGIIYDKKSNGKLGANWIMLWNGNNTEKDLAGHLGNVPLEVIFQRHPEKIERINNKIVISFKDSGAIWLCAPYGTRIQPTKNWRGLLPADAALRADLYGKTSLAYPVECHEFYRYNQENTSVTIKNKYAYRLFDDNDWNIIPQKIAPLPPLLALMMDNGFNAIMPEKLFDLEFPTLYGPLRAVSGEEITYSMPVPDIPLLEMGKNVSADKKDVDRIVNMTAHRFHGGRSYLLEERGRYQWHSLMFFDGIMQQWAYLPKSYRDYMYNVFRHNVDFASNYRDNRVWRSVIEPYSGQKYYYSFSIQAGGPGEVGVFGDRGFGVGLHMWFIDRVIEYSGDYDLLRRLWKDNNSLAPSCAVKDGRTITIDKVFGYLKNVHDWAYMFAGSNDCGDNGPVVDCAQSTFAGHAAYMRMAQKIGSDEDIAKGAYYLAKSLPGLLGRTVFDSYGQENGLFGPDSINVGFRECLTPDCFANNSRFGKYYFGTYCANLCYAASDDGFDVFFPYSRYVWNTFRKEERKRKQYYPNYDTDAKRFYTYVTATSVQFRIMNGQPLKQLRKIYDNIVGKSHYAGDLKVLPWLICGGNPLTLTNWYPVPLPESEFNPETETVTITFESLPEQYQLHAMSSVKPEEITIDGKILSGWDYNQETYKLKLPLPASSNAVVKIKYKDLDLTRITPLPLPSGPKTLPEMEGNIDYSTFERATLVVPTAKKESGDNIIFSSSFDHKTNGDKKVSGGFRFNNWGGATNPVSGGVSSDPENSLEVLSASKGYSGRMSPYIDIPVKFKELVISGQVIPGNNYTGNYPMIFVWIIDGNRKGKGYFNHINKFTKEEWNNFTMRLPYNRLPVNSKQMVINLTSCKDQTGKNAEGSAFFRNIKVTVN